MPVKSTGLSEKGLRSEFFRTFDETHKAEARWPKFCTQLKSKSDLETYRFLGTVPAVRTWGTGRKAKGLGVESYIVENERYESTLEVDRIEVDDDQTGQIRLRIQDLARRMATHKDYFAANLLMSGETTGYNSYDGVTFFNAAHVSGASGNQSNTTTYDATLTDAPTDVECRAAFSKCVAMMAQWKDDQGEIEDYGMSGLMVLCHPQVWFTWTRALRAGLLGGGDTNIMPVSAEVLYMPWFTDISKFYVLRNGGSIRAFICQDRDPIEFSSLAEKSTEEFMREKYYFGVRGRYKIAYALPQHAVVCDMV